MKVLPVRVTPPRRKMNVDLSVQNRRIEEERVWDEWNGWNNEQMEAAEGINRELEGHLVRMRPFSLTTQALKKQVVYTALE